MKRTIGALAVAALLAGGAGSASLAQSPPPPAAARPATPQPYVTGNPLGVPAVPSAERPFQPLSSNVKVFGSIYSAESCSYDSERGLIVVPSRGAPPSVQVNNAWISLLNSDGSVHTARWIGVQGPGPQREALNPPLMLNEPFGSDVVNGILYLADRDGGATPDDPARSVVRRFDMKTGVPLGDVHAAGAGWFNDIAVTSDGTIYGTVTGAHQVWRVSPDGQASLFAEGSPLELPNGVALDPQGNVVVVNVGSSAVLTFAPEGDLIKTEHAAQSGSDGIVIMADGTKYVSSVVEGGVSRIVPGEAAQLIAENIPSAASMCYDAGARQLVIPLNDNNAVALLKLD